MITKIGLNGVASYKSLSTLETDKKVNLIYGLNGTGKSILQRSIRDNNCPYLVETHSLYLQKRVYYS